MLSEPVAVLHDLASIWAVSRVDLLAVEERQRR